MKELRLERLTLENFKGVKQLELRLEGRNAEISGENGCGKTTVADGYTWLLTNKLTNGRGAEYTPYEVDGSLNTSVTSVVEAEFTDGLKLRRESNGASRFYLNGEALKSREYFEAVGELTNGAAGLLAIPQNFCKMHWSDRRTILMGLFGRIEALEVIGAEPSLEPLAGQLAQRTVEQILQTNGAKIKGLRQELSGIPARIDELSRQTETGDRGALETEIAALEKRLVEAAAAVKAEQEKSKLEMAPFNEANRLRKVITEAGDWVKARTEELARQGGERQTLREKWASVSAAMQGTCPVCGTKVASVKADELKTRLVEIEKRGSELGRACEALERKIAAGQARLRELTAEAEKLERQFKEVESQRTGESSLTLAIEARDAIAEKLNLAKVELAKAEAAATAAVRIEELKAQEIALNAEMSGLEQEVALAQAFIATQIRLVEESVNGQFEYVKFKMFESYKTTDGVRECCEPVINGVPYGGNLSKGERLKAALDILRALQKAYGVELPVFIDDAESYTSNTAIALPNQVIRLAAAEGELRVQVLK